CPHCNYTSTRAPDRRRHAETHTGDSTPPRWFCNGLRPAEARKRGINIKGMPVYIIQAQKRVGGCLMAFSRRDAMLRHRRTSGGQCFG
ncbi:uncharacterized protein BXZ73DRAFT_5716, partial [Epithele typhae]|uniref:uncharacterized protein n=1 Tax=Epithele typhae TaxID=378194 RepID=UPI0020082D42